VATCAALFVGSLAIALSVSRLVGKRAVFAFYVGVVSFLAVTWAIDALGGTKGYVSYMTAVNPFLALRALLNPTGYAYQTAGSHIGIAAWFLESPVVTFCALSGGLSVLLMGASTITVRLGGIAGLGGQGGRGGVPWYRKMFGLGAKGGDHRAPKKVWNNPIAWREAAARNATLGRMAARWLFIILGAIWGIGITVYFHTHAKTLAPSDFRNVVLYTVVGEMIVVALVALNMSATAVAREREDGTLDLLLTTPITPAAYLGGKVRGMIAYLLPLLAVPIGTLVLAGFYVLLGDVGLVSHEGGMAVSYGPFTDSTGKTVTLAIPAVLPEAGIVLAIVTLPFVAFCCMVGLMFSLKSKGSIGSVVSTVGLVGVVAGIVGLCSWQAGASVPILGPVLAALNPLTAAWAGIFAELAMNKTVTNGGVETGLTAARAGLFIGSLIGGGVWIGVVYGLRASLVHNFDMTVRRLAGAS
jgi:hypothetical protein